MGKSSVALTYIKKFSLNETAMDICRKATGEPARRVNSGGRSKMTLFPSSMMGCVLQAESDLEYAFILQCETDPGVVAIYDQPMTFNLSFTRLDGRRQAIRHTPDSFVVQPDGLYFFECKRLDELLLLCEKYPDRYCYDQSEKCFRSPVMERKLEGTGIGYRFFTDGDCNPQLLANIRHLMDFFRGRKNQNLNAKQQACVEFVSNSVVMTIGELLNRHPKLRVDDVLEMIACRKLFVDLERDKLSEPESCKVFATESSCQIYSMTRESVSSNGHEFIGRGNTPITEGMVCRHGEQQWLFQSIETKRQTALVEISGVNSIQLKSFKLEDVRELIRSKELTVVQCEHPEDDQTSLMLSASEGNQKAALQRHKTIQQVVVGDISRKQAAEQLGCSTRTIRRYMKRYHDGVLRRGTGLPELVNNDQAKGNTKKSVVGKSMELANEVISTEYLDPKNKTIMSVYRDYVRICHDHNVPAASYSWLRRLIKKVDLGKCVGARQGHKKARALMPITGNDGVIESRRGTRSFEYVHVDHTQLDVALKFPGKDSSKPWLIIATDSYSRSVLAIYLTMKSPCTDSVLMVVRELVKRYGRLPESFFVDGGSEFESVVFEQFCAFYGVTIHSRKSNPRGGSAVEGVFKQLNEAVIHSLTGNTQLMKNPRQLTSKVNPFQTALWNFQALNQLLGEYFYEHYNKTEHPAHFMIPDDVLADSVVRHGERKYHQVDINDEQFQIMMLPYDKNKRTRVVQPVKGVERLGKYYSHDLFATPDWLGREVEIRFDPQDDSYVYCNLDGWKRCVRVDVEDRYYAGIDRSVITEANSASRGFHSPEQRAERAIPGNRKIAEMEGGLREVQSENETGQAEKNQDEVPITIAPGRNDIEDF
ncbi:DDE-type integrase/transposase/recombinase [Endozoicomonas atrinae]|uniref:DDE-type integrase/transposase/recombinase n=1 Tax=Endozoicomonas atrinae TaxID=1333660 RepID=UPI0008241AB9|nr:DDE-type integrase/transposase/recombinase [Endozoicomonas atrinae]